MSYTKLLLLSAAISALVPRGKVQLSGTVGVVVIIVVAAGVNTQLYQWSCSSLDASNSRFTLPNLGYGDAENVARLGTGNVTLSGGFMDIYPVPSALNCSGVVSAVEHCYVGSASNPLLGQTVPAFTLLILQQSGLTFTVTNVIDVQSMASREICTDVVFSMEVTLRYCCDSMPLDSTASFNLPASEFAIGVVPGSSISGLSYRVEVFPQFRVERFSVDSSDTPAFGTTFTLTDANRNTDLALRLLQLAISKLYIDVLVCWCACTYANCLKARSSVLSCHLAGRA